VSRHRSISALLVDMPPAHAALIERTLLAAGWTVRSVPVHGAEALSAALQRRGWHVVLYGGEGEDAVPARKALALVRMADPHLPLIAVSPFVRPGDLTSIIRGLADTVPAVSNPAALPAVLTRELEQARMRRRVGGAHRMLLAQQAITDHLAAGLEHDTLCHRVLATLGDTLGWSFGAVWRIDPEESVLRCTSVWHSPGARRPVADFAAGAHDLTYAPGQGLPGRVWAFRRPAWVADVAGDSNLARANAALHAGLMTAVAFPIAVADDECVGVIEFYSGDIREPSAEVSAMFASVGGQLAQYLARKRVRARARRSLDNAGALVVALDEEGRVELANTTVCTHLQTQEADLLGRDWFAASVAEDRRDGARAAFARLVSGDHGETLALTHALPGTLQPIVWRWSLSRGPDGEPLGALGWGEPQVASATSVLVAGLAAALTARDRRVA
jgi:GAF domain-containing protein